MAHIRHSYGFPRSGLGFTSEGKLRRRPWKASPTGEKASTMCRLLCTRCRAKERVCVLESEQEGTGTSGIARARQRERARERAREGERGGRERASEREREQEKGRGAARYLAEALVHVGLRQRDALGLSVGVRVRMLGVRVGGSGWCLFRG